MWQRLRAYLFNLDRGPALRLWAMITKEFAQMIRDRATLGLMMGIPLIQLILFGFAIKSILAAITWNFPKRSEETIRAACDLFWSLSGSGQIERT